MRRALESSPRLVALCGLLLFAVGCSHSDKESVCRPEVPAGRIEGVVRTGAALTDVQITATRIPTGDQSTFVGQAAPDSAGGYHIDVPAGRYVIALWVGSQKYYSYARAGLSYTDGPMDTLLIDTVHSAQGVNFDLATVRVRVTVPSQLNGRGGVVTLHRRGGGWSIPSYLPMNHGSARVQNGKFEAVVRCVIPGSYKVEMDIGYEGCLCIGSIYEGEHFWLPSTRDSSQTAWTDVPVNQTADVVGGIDLSPARIEGEVVGAWQALGVYDRPEISLFSLDSTLVMGPRTVGNQGTFALDVIFPCPVKVRIAEDGFEQWIGGSFRSATTFALEHGQTVTGVRLVQSGLVFDVSPDSAGFGLIEGEVRLYDGASGSLIGKFSPSEMGGEHSFGIANLRPGTYLCRIDREYWRSGDWLPQWFDRSPTQAGARVITITSEGEVVPVHVALDIGGRITGAIIDAASPGARHLVYFTPTDDPAQSGFVFEHNGTYSIHGLPDGNYKVGVWRQVAGQYPSQPPSSTAWYPGTSDWNAAQAVQIHDHEAVSSVDIVLSR